MKIATKLYNNVNYTIINFSPHSSFSFTIIDNKCSKTTPCNQNSYISMLVQTDTGTKINVNRHSYLSIRIASQQWYQYLPRQLTYYKLLLSLKFSNWLHVY